MDVSFLKVYYLVSSCPLDLGTEVLHGLVQSSVAAQLGLHGGQVGAPLSPIKALLVLFHPGEQVLGVAQRDLIQLRPCLGLLLLADLDQGGLGDRWCRLQPEVVVAAQVHQTLVQTVDPATDRNVLRYNHLGSFLKSVVFGV